MIPNEELLKEENAKVLGIEWNHIDDTMQLGVREVFETADKIEPTKRNILKIIAAIYDPVGFLAPILINLKLFFQEICLLDIGWDEHIGNLKQKWFTIVKLLSTYADFKIKRRYFIEKADDPV